MTEGIYIRMLPYFLLGYAVAGRSFAYLGIPPLYMGEILFMFGLWQLLQTHHLWKVFLQPSAWALAFFMLWGAARTVPYIPQYGLMALRDGVLWGYGLFAFVIAMILIARPTVLLMLFEQYHSFARVFPFITLIGLISLIFFKRVIFDISEFFQMKPGDIMVHLATILSLAVCGLLSNVSLPWIAALAGSVLVAGSIGRGGLLAFSLSISVILLLRIRYISTWKIKGLLLFSFLVIGGLLLLLPQENENKFMRKISPEQIIKNMASVVVPAEEWGLEGTKRYRLQWWDKIINYTVFGDYFVGGKGYGINLAEVDDQLLHGDLSLRSPHNAHLTILARSGVPGLCLWIVLNLTWFCGMLGVLIDSKFRNLGIWEGWFCALLAFYIAALVNASFDVYLEGPMGGIWFWSVFGIGMASMHLYRTLPELMAADEDIAHT